MVNITQTVSGKRKITNHESPSMRTSIYMFPTAIINLCPTQGNNFHNSMCITLLLNELSVENIIKGDDYRETIEAIA